MKTLINEHEEEIKKLKQHLNIPDEPDYPQEDASEVDEEDEECVEHREIYGALDYIYEERRHFLLFSISAISAFSSSRSIFSSSTNCETTLAYELL